MKYYKGVPGVLEKLKNEGYNKYLKKKKIMGTYENREYFDMLMCLGQCEENEGRVATLYANKFPQRRSPRRNVIARLRDRLINEGGGLQPRNRNAGRPYLGGNEEGQILRYFDRHPRDSLRRAALFLGMSRMRVWRSLKLDNQRPWHDTKVQHLEELDPANRLAYSNWYVHQYEQDPDNFPKVIMHTDESIFTQDSIINLHNDHTWSEENPHCTVDRSFQRRFSLNVWGGIIDDKIVSFVIYLFISFYLFIYFLAKIKLIFFFLAYSFSPWKIEWRKFFGFSRRRITSNNRGIATGNPGEYDVSIGWSSTTSRKYCS